MTPPPHTHTWGSPWQTEPYLAQDSSPVCLTLLPGALGSNDTASLLFLKLSGQLPLGPWRPLVPLAWKGQFHIFVWFVPSRLPRPR